MNFKYIVFRGELTIAEHNNGTSTLVGQANSAGAMAVGAVLYSNTPAFGVNPPTIASFSSIGGTPVNGVVRSKPEFTAPNGVNTSVNLGGPNIDGDGSPNFFGTSAAAPHAAAVAALLINGKNKFYNEVLTPAQVRSILTSTALDMSTPGFDFISGAGFLRADEAMATFAAPTPVITSLDIPSGTTPGTTPFIVTVEGGFLNPQSVVIVRGVEVPTVILNNNQAQADIPAFTGNPPIQIYTPPITPNGNDGGYSDSLFFFAPVKKAIRVVADLSLIHI